MSNSVSFGARLRSARNRRKLSQGAMSALAGQSREMIGRYERGEAEPGIGVLIALAQHGFDAAFLLTGEPRTLTKDEETLLAAYRELDEVAKAGLQGMVRGMQSQSAKAIDAKEPPQKDVKKGASKRAGAAKPKPQ